MAQTIKESVLRLYMSHPFPLLTSAERHQLLPWKICSYEYLGLAEHMPNARLLDVGCGTGDNTVLPAAHYGVREWVGLDQSRASLDLAIKNAREEGFDRFTPVEGDALNLPFDDNSFDIVVSWGVLHHTSDAKRGFAEMVRVCRPGGRVALYLYNRYAHWRHNLQKNKVSRLAGDDIEKRFEVAHDLYGDKPQAEMTPTEIARFYDQYCHPHKTDHTIGETLDWFDQLGVQYAGSFPPLGLRDALSALQFRGTALSTYPLERPRSRIAVAAASRLPLIGKRASIPPPSLFHRALWQSVYAWMGRRGGYSAGAALSGRKV